MKKPFQDDLVTNQCPGGADDGQEVAKSDRSNEEDENVGQGLDMSRESPLEVLGRYLLAFVAILCEGLALCISVFTLFAVYDVPMVFLLPVLLVGCFAGACNQSSVQHTVALICVTVLFLVRMVYLYVTVDGLDDTIVTVSFLAVVLALVFQLWRLYNKLKSD